MKNSETTILNLARRVGRMEILVEQHAREVARLSQASVEATVEFDAKMHFVGGDRDFLRAVYGDGDEDGGF